MTLSLLAHDREGSLRYPHRPEEVGLELFAQLLLGDLFHHPEVAVARIVDHDIERAEVLRRVLHSSTRRGMIGDIEFKG